MTVTHCKASVKIMDMKNEQELITKTQVKFDLIDRIKVLFGAIPEIEVKVIVPIKEGQEIEMYNGVSNVKLLSKTKSNFTKDKSSYGYSPME